MNTLREAVTDYLAMRRALGFKLQWAGVALMDFVSFQERRGADYITIPLALEWAQQLSSAQPAQWAKRLCWVRGFARFRSSSDARTEIPPLALLPHKSKRARPYLYTDEEIHKLLEAAAKIEPARVVLKRQTYYCLLGLLAVTGMRPGEAIDLKITNVDLVAGVLRLEGTKFGKSRLVPLHKSTQKVLSDYRSCRDTFLNGRPAINFFINSVGKPLNFAAVHRNFYLLSRQIGIREPDSRDGPRLMDFRHLFAVKTLLQWYRNGEDAERRLPILSTYLGHVNVSDTYWYLTAFPELMGAAVQRLEENWEAQS